MYRQQIPKKTSPSSSSIPINQQTTPTSGYGSLSGVIQRATANPESLGRNEWLQLNSAIGTKATKEIKSGKRTSYAPEFKGISAQLWDDSGQLDAPIQRKENNDIEVSEVQPENNTGLPDNLKAGVENLSGYSLDNVRVHYNSPKPAQLQALAYTQGTNIHIAPRQEEHLPHEAWHVVQQMQGRVKPTMQMKGVQINDDAGLEKEADLMGNKVVHDSTPTHVTFSTLPPSTVNNISSTPIQRLVGFEIELSVPTMGSGFKSGGRFANGPNGTPCPATVKKFLTNGLEYGRNDLGRNPNFRLSGDHNRLAQLGRDVFNKLSNNMHYAYCESPSDLGNLEYATKPLDELAPRSTRAFNTQFNAIRNHINGLFPAVTNKIISVPNTGKSPYLSMFFGHKVYAGIPVKDFKTWLGDRYNEVEPEIQAVWNATQKDKLYLQATAGIIPSALPDLFQSQTKRTDSTNTNTNIKRYQYVANIIENLITELFKEKDFRNHTYVTNLENNNPVEYEAFKGVLFLIVSYLLGHALYKTTFFSADDTTSKNVMLFLSQTRLHRIMSEAAPTFLRNNPPPDDLIETVKTFVSTSDYFKPDWWVVQSKVKARNDRSNIIYTTMTTFIERILKGQPINPDGEPRKNFLETPSSHNYNPDLQQAAVRNASQDQQGIPLEFRHIKKRPNPEGLPNELMEIVKQVREFNTKHMPEDDRKALIAAADR